MDVIIGDEVKTPSVTSREYLQAENGFVVSTRLPANIFSFGANGDPVTVRGSAILQLAGSGRKLRVGNLFDVDGLKDEEKARYEVKVNLLSDGTDGDGTVASSSANSIEARFSFFAAASLGMALFVLARIS